MRRLREVATAIAAVLKTTLSLDETDKLSKLVPRWLKSFLD